jgi:hypothetical protein
MSAGGCASSKGRQAPATRRVAVQAAAPATLAAYHEPASPRRPAAALVFAPPVAYDAPELDLSRDDRRPSAFMGYPEGVTEFFYVRWDDRQAGGDSGGCWGSSSVWGGGGSHDRYERRAISEKVGVLNR